LVYNAPWDWRRLHKDELPNLYSSLYTIMMIETRRMRWAGLATRMRNMRNAGNILVEKPERENKLKDLDVNGKIISESILRI